ncbi:2-oxoglutarate-dependent dioxygenase AOP3-like [Impatiens glandulifera]|uniref:2-oxoglutarate-dependent dioxygenase AOP3-like n=1 Tax=Impatiens glandulifera TaxID=253017 RepID=UPI001FB19A9C|nr:2-oxoglutarate-dependent dioxygenase AOP3-like [Impatiens glandulifera]
MPNTETAAPKLPIIDLRGLIFGTSSWISTCKEIRSALEEHGCFVALSDIVSDDLEVDVLNCLKDLFSLPSEIKSKNISDKPIHGYFGRRPLSPLLESLAIENPNYLQSVQDFAALMWPQGNHPFCETIHKYGNATNGLVQMVTRMLFHSYGIEKKQFEAHIESMNTLLRVLEYIPPKSCEAEVGSSAHTDKSFLTVLHQCQTSGLEVETKTGGLLSVDFPPSSFLIIAGEACQGWSNGRVHPAVHGVKMEPTVDQMRYSMALFVYGKGTIEVAKELIDDDHPMLFKPFNNYELLRFFTKDPIKRKIKNIEEFCGV